MRGAGHQVRALRERLLEMGPDQPQHVGHVVHDHGVETLLVQETADLGHRLLVQHHALAEDDQLRPVLDR